MMTLASKKPLRPSRNHRQAGQLFLWLENALNDPVVDTHEFLAAVGRLAALLEQMPSSNPSRDIIRSRNADSA